MIITTTNTIENVKIEQYLGVVTANCVVGTNFISDFTASFTDFFGGMSGTYQRKLRLIYGEAMNSLKENAQLKGANAIVGLSVDFDEISGKGKSMFMISVIGTAVKIDESQKTTKVLTSMKPNEINMSLVKEHIERIGLIDKVTSLEEYSYPNESSLRRIIELGIVEVASNLRDKYIEACSANYDTAEYEEFFYKYISRIGYANAIEPIYEKLKDYPDIITQVINKNNLFNSQKIEQLLPFLEIKNIVELLQCEKETYNYADIAPMEMIVTFLENMPNKGGIKEVAGLFGGRSMKYVCPDGHRNVEEEEFCVICGKNAKGLTRFDICVIEEFKLKVKFLKSKLMQ